MENTKSHTPVALRKQIGGTMYVVRVHFNEDAKETMKDKIKRLIENDVRGTQHTAQVKKHVEKLYISWYNLCVRERQKFEAGVYGRRKYT